MSPVVKAEIGTDQEWINIYNGFVSGLSGRLRLRVFVFPLKQQVLNFSEQEVPMSLTSLFVSVSQIAWELGAPEPRI